jgi:hypothetical protein
MNRQRARFALLTNVYLWTIAMERIAEL